MGLIQNSVFAIDWLEGAGTIAWEHAVSREAFWRLDQAQAEARENRAPVAYKLADRSMLLHERGMGTGKQSHLEYRFEFAGVMIGVSQRDEATRQHSNLYYKIPGEACLLIGAEPVRNLVKQVVEELGGYVTDEWLRRLDLCLDVAGLNVRDELMPLFERGQFSTTAKKWNPWDGADGKTGFTVGSRNRVLLRVYDKLLDAHRQHDGIYRQAMMERRWNGTLPQAATRIEYQMSREWLQTYGLMRADQVLADLPDVVAKLIERQPRYLFALLDRIPDRENKHQSRSGLHPLWEAITERMLSLAGLPRSPLMPVNRSLANLDRLWSMIRGGITSAAAKMGRYCASLDDALEIVRILDERQGATGEDWERRWEDKARKYGTLDDVVSFNPQDEGMAA